MKRAVYFLLVAIASLVSVFAGAQDLHFKAPRVPDFVVFAGDTVRMDRLDFRERMDRELLSFTNMHTNSVLMLKRSRRVFGLVVPILKEQGLPEDLKYLMAIESNLDPQAVSRTGAAGLWQFTKATAQTYEIGRAHV